MKRGCTQCGECLNVCPVYALFKREEYAPKGKRILMEPLDPEFGNGQTVTPDLAWEKVRELSRLCAGCGRCARVCARKLSTAELLADARSRHPHWSQFMWSMWIRNLGPMWPIAGRIAMLMPQAIVPGADLTGLVNMAKSLVAKPTLTPWFLLKPKQKVSGKRVVVFSGCTAKYARPAWTAKAVSLLRAWGYEILDGSRFVCCGGTLHHAGEYAAQQEVSLRNLAIWTELERPYVATFCASCLHSLKGYSAFLNANDARLWQERVFPLSHLLENAQVLPTGAGPETIGYHEPCHWDGQDKDLPLLAQGFTVQKGTALCCGMGGILKMSNAGLSAKMAQRCLEGIACQDILTGCSGCVMQLSGEAGTKNIRHWLEVCAAK